MIYAGSLVFVSILMGSGFNAFSDEFIRSQGMTVHTPHSQKPPASRKKSRKAPKKVAPQASIARKENPQEGRGLVCRPVDSHSKLPKIELKLTEWIPQGLDQSTVNLPIARDHLHSSIETAMGVDQSVVLSYLGDYLWHTPSPNSETLKLSVLPALALKPVTTTNLPGQSAYDSRSLSLIEYQREHGISAYKPEGGKQHVFFKSLKAEFYYGPSNTAEYYCDLIAGSSDRVFVYGGTGEGEKGH